MKANEQHTVEQLGTLETACFMHKYENENLVSAFRNFFDQDCTNIVKNTASSRQKKATLIIFQVIAESTVYHEAILKI